jgi:hypothetical protein
MGKPEAILKEPAIEIEESGIEEVWPETDGLIEDLILEVSPFLIEDEPMERMVREMREFMIAQFEKEGVATRDQVYNHAEELDEEDSDFNIDDWGFPTE